MTRDEALKLLRLDKAACAITEHVITTAYRRELLEVHPDTAAPVGLTGDARTVDQIKMARDVLRQAATGQENPCGQCKGRGTVRVRYGVAPCGACKGTGDKAP